MALIDQHMYERIEITMKKVYENPKSEFVTVNQEHIYTIMSGATEAVAFNWEDFVFDSEQ